MSGRNVTKILKSWGKLWNGNKYIIPLMTALAGSYENEVINGTHISCVGPLTIWRVTGVGNATISIPVSTSSYYAQLLGTSEYNSKASVSQPTDGNVAKSIYVYQNVEQLKIVMDSSIQWQITGMFFNS